MAKMLDVGPLEFAVWEFMDSGPDAGRHRYIRRWIDIKTAFYVVLARVAQSDPAVSRIIITNGMDETVLEWERGKGITWPGGISLNEQIDRYFGIDGPANDCSG
jgi:hypothetical protein